MNVTDYFKDKRFLIGGGLLIGSMLIYKMFSAKSNPQTVVMTAEGMSEGNLALITQAQEFTLNSESLKNQKEVALKSLENDRYVTDAGVTMLKENNEAYLTGLEANNQLALASQVSQQDYALMQTREAAALNRYLNDSMERIKSGEILLEHAKEGSVREKQNQEYNVALQRINAESNLANYQAMISHDLGKKQIGASTTNTLISGLTSVANLFTPKAG